MMATSLPRILLVEDDDIIREIYTMKLELEGFPVMAAENGQIALDVVEDFKPDIILLDMMMPVLGGLDVMRTWHKNGELPGEVIVFSNISAPAHMNEVMDLGAADYWVKSDYTPERAVDALSARWKQRQA
jgi:CheY-like chemotaxis protein